MGDVPDRESAGAELSATASPEKAVTDHNFPTALFSRDLFIKIIMTLLISFALVLFKKAWNSRA